MVEIYIVRLKFCSMVLHLTKEELQHSKHSFDVPLFTGEKNPIIKSAIVSFAAGL